jgi:3',5'-cyclic AMP phosphodiesterase CpdA
MAQVIKIAQLADIHFGAEDAEAIKYAKQIIGDEAPDIIAVCGDVTQRGKRVEFQKALGFLNGFQPPVLVVPGNHDVPLLNMASRFKAPFKRFEKFLGGFDDVVSVKAHTVLGINSARGWQARQNWAEGSVNLDRLRRGLERHRPSILMAHHPFTQPPGARLRVETRRGKRALSLAANLGVKLILTGHVHEPSVTMPSDREGTPISISCGTLSSRLRQSPPSLNIIEFSGAGLNARAIEASSRSTERTLVEHQFQTDGTFSH